MASRFQSPEAAAGWLQQKGCGRLQTDSRMVQTGDAFIAWSGHVSDGRKFVPAALAAGAAACLITDDWPGLEAFFEPGTEILVAPHGDEVARQVDRLSAGVARKIGRAARARALAEHTYAHRAAQFDAVIEGRSVGRPLEVMA